MTPFRRSGIAASILLPATLSVGCLRPVAETGPPPAGLLASHPDRWAKLVPVGFPLPLAASDDPHPALAELGRHLFYDPRLSGNGTQSCSSCHQQQRAFTDGLAQAIGSTGERHHRSSMTLTNVAYNSSFTWANGALVRLEDQLAIPLFNEHPIEMGVRGREEMIFERLRAEPRYRALTATAFPDDPDPINLANVKRALTAFVGTLISANSPYDRVVFKGDSAAMPAEAWRGMSLFFSERVGCSQCHQGFNFSGPVRTHELTDTESTFHNTALYNVDGKGSYPEADSGLYGLTKAPGDMGRFRAPTLRNVVVTAPYMHDGSVPDLAAVIEHYSAGGRSGEDNPSRSALIRPFSLNDQEKKELIAFLEALTDEQFLSSPRFADPWISISVSGHNP